MGVDADIAVACCIDRNRVNLITGNFAVAVCLLDGVRNLVRVGRVRNVCRARDDRVDIVGLVDVSHAKVLNLRLAEEVVRVCLQRDNTVLILLKHVRACADRLRGLCANQAEVALRETELVVCIVVLRLITVVVKRANRDSELINHLRIDLGCNHAEGVVAGLLDTRDVRRGSSGLDTDRELVVIVHELKELGSRALLGGHILHAAVVSREHRVEEIHCGRIRLEIRIAVICRDSRNRVALLVGAVCNVGVHDFLHKCLCGLVVGSPELLLLILGPLGEVRVVLACLYHQVKEGIHTASVSLHALDRKCEEGRSAVIGRIREDIHGENDVINRERLAVFKLKAVLQGEIVVDRAVAVLGDNEIGDTLIGVLLTVVLAGLSLNAL